MPPKKKNWIQSAIKHPGALHQELGIPKGQKIPVKVLKLAAESDDPQLRRRARLALTLRKINKKKMK